MTGPACAGRPEAYDVLIDGNTRNPGYRVARCVALDLCTGCPVRNTCWIENRDEEWLLALRGVA